jgi:hypothetical protein
MRHLRFIGSLPQGLTRTVVLARASSRLWTVRIPDTAVHVPYRLQYSSFYRYLLSSDSSNIQQSECTSDLRSVLRDSDTRHVGHRVVELSAEDCLG